MKGEGNLPEPVLSGIDMNTQSRLERLCVTSQDITQTPNKCVLMSCMRLSTELAVNTKDLMRTAMMAQPK